MGLAAPTAAVPTGGASATAPAFATPVRIELVFDGGVHGEARRHLHHGRYAFHAAGDARLAHAGYEVYRNATSNRAEYLALKGALRGLLTLARECGVDLHTIELCIFTDSQLVARQLRAEWAVEDPTLRTLNLRVGAQLRQMGSWQIEWRPRLDINARLAEAPQPALPRHATHLAKPLLKPHQPGPQPDAARRRAVAHDAKRFAKATRSVHSANERVELQTQIERTRLDAAAAKRAHTRLAQKLGATPAELTRAITQADDYLARIPNTQHSRDDLIARFVEIERKQAARAAAAVVAPAHPSTNLPHPDLAHQPAYVAIVHAVDAHLAEVNSNLSRLALIEHQWKVHCQREALKQQQPWHSIRRADGSPAFVTGRHNETHVVSQAQLLQPGPSVRCFPDMAMAALRENWACEFRVWEIARHLDAAGSGQLLYATLRDFLCQTHNVFTVRRFQQLVRRGEAGFWVKHTRWVLNPVTGKRHRETWLRLRGQADVAGWLNLSPLRIHCVRVKLADLLQGMGRAHAALFTAFHAGRGEREKHNGPISRATLRDLSGKSGSAQRTYDRVMGTTARANYARTGIPASSAGLNELGHAALRHEGAAFVVNDSIYRRRLEGQSVSHPIFGHGAIAVRLPNTYRADSTHFERACAGRKRRINQGLHQRHQIEHSQSANHLVGKGGRGNNLAVLQRRYFETRPLAQKAWDKRCCQAMQHEARAAWAHPDAARELYQAAALLRRPTYALRQGGVGRPSVGWNRVGVGFAEEVNGLG